MRIQTIPCRTDNLSYLVIDEPSRTCVIVDPSAATPFLDAIEEQGLTLQAIVTTHHHHDHIDGLPDLREVPVWSSERDLDRIPGAGSTGSRAKRRAFTPGQAVTWKELGETSTPETAKSPIRFEVVSIPGHTEGQIAILVSDSTTNEPPHVFVGDTLFALGCGRCIEGTPEELFASLQLLKTLPETSLVYFGHEYTERNAEFWLHHGAELDKNTEGSFKVDTRDIEKILESYHRLRHSPKNPTSAPTLKNETGRNPFLQIKNASEFTHWRLLRNKF